MAIDLLSDIQISSTIASLPKVDLHLHQEEIARFASVIAQRLGRQIYDPRPWIKQMMVETPPGMGRINAIYSPDKSYDFQADVEDEPENISAKMTNALLEGAKDGAIYMEIQFGAGSVAFTHPDFMKMFREAENQVRELYPQFFAEALCFVVISKDELRVESQIRACLEAAKEGLAGVNFRIDPYDNEADPLTWKKAYEMAELVSDLGLGITIHAGEFSPANIIAASRTPGVRRLGHAVYAVSQPHILEAVAKSGVTVECSLSCNVVLGAVNSFETHPIKRLMANNIPVTLTTDLPTHLRTTIGKEYAIAAELGLSTDDLLQITQNGINASFTSEDRRLQLFKESQK